MYMYVHMYFNVQCTVYYIIVYFNVHGYINFRYNMSVNFVCIIIL